MRYSERGVRAARAWALASLVVVASWHAAPATAQMPPAILSKERVTIQPPKDASLEPSRVLGAELQRRGKQHVVKLYPAEMPEDQQGHCFGGARGMHVWAQDVLAFLAGALR
jgi:hypothetical protein